MEENVEICDTKYSHCCVNLENLYDNGDGGDDEEDNAMMMT
jgi:hypothetical protein